MKNLEKVRSKFRGLSVGLTAVRLRRAIVDLSETKSSREVTRHQITIYDIHILERESEVRSS